MHRTHSRGWDINERSRLCCAVVSPHSYKRKKEVIFIIMVAHRAPLQIFSLRIADTAGSAVAFEAFDLPSSIQRLLGPPHPPKTQIPLALRPTENVTTLD